MSKKLIVFAQLAEAKKTIERFEAKVQEKHALHIWSEGLVPNFYACDFGWIVLCNIGIHSAQWAVSKYGSLADEIWNLGFAGRLKGELEIGKILSVSKVGKYVPLKEEELDEASASCVENTLPSFSFEGNEGNLISSDFPIHSEEHRSRLSLKWDLVDMEGYGVAFASYHLGKKCRIWKIISDFASPGGRALIRKNKEALSQLLADQIESELYVKKNHESGCHS